MNLYQAMDSTGGEGDDINDLQSDPYTASVSTTSSTRNSVGLATSTVPANDRFRQTATDAYSVGTDRSSQYREPQQQDEQHRGNFQEGHIVAVDPRAADQFKEPEDAYGKPAGAAAAPLARPPPVAPTADGKEAKPLDEAPPPTSRNHSKYRCCYLTVVAILVLLITAGIAVIVVVLVLDDDGGDGSSVQAAAPSPPPPTPAPTDPPPCSLCADGSQPDYGRLVRGLLTCRTYADLQLPLIETPDDPRCLAVQADGWFYCNCPTLPTLADETELCECPEDNQNSGLNEGFPEQCNNYRTYVEIQARAEAADGGDAAVACYQQEQDENYPLPCRCENL